MIVLLTERAEAEIGNQLSYSIEHFGRIVAERTFGRVDEYLFGYLSRYPRTGRFIDHLNVFETWIPRTPFVVFYRTDTIADTITVVAFFHHAQDRSTFESD